MAVTQYIGARYVPIFADPAEWTNTKQYEPLTIVLHQGNSFTSRQFVPVGVDIDDTDYWAETGNYNAQVEQYRQEVLRYDEYIHDRAIAFENVLEMKSYASFKNGDICHTNGFYEKGDNGASWYVITNAQTADEMTKISCGEFTAELVITNDMYVEQFGAHGDGETDDATIIQTAIDSGIGILRFSNKTYVTSTTLNIVEPIQLIGSNSWYIENPNVVANGSFIKSTANICINIRSESVHVKNIAGYGVLNTFIASKPNVTNPEINTSTFNVIFENCASIARTNGADQTTGFWIKRSVAAEINHCAVVGGYYGFQISEATVTSTVLRNCWARNVYESAYYFIRATYVTLINCFSDINKHFATVVYGDCISFIGCGTEFTTTAYIIENAKSVNISEMFVYNSSASNTTPTIAQLRTCENVNISGSYVGDENDSSTLDVVVLGTQPNIHIAKNLRNNIPNMNGLEIFFVDTINISNANTYSYALSQIPNLSDINIVGVVPTVKANSTTGDYYYSTKLDANNFSIRFSVTQNYAISLMIFYYPKTEVASAI